MFVYILPPTYSGILDLHWPTTSYNILSMEEIGIISFSSGQIRPSPIPTLSPRHYPQAIYLIKCQAFASVATILMAPILFA